MVWKSASQCHYDSTFFQRDFENCLIRQPLLITEFAERANTHIRDLAGERRCLAELPGPA